VKVTERTEHEVAARLGQIQERLWVMQAQQGDPEAFRSLVNRYERQLLYYLMRFTPNPEHAADALQEVWLTAFRGLKNLQAPEAFRVWLYRITHDKILSLVRREARKEEVIEALRNEPAAEAFCEDHRAEDAELVHRALSSLSPEHREVLTLRFLEDLSLEEISEALRCQPGTVKSRLHYAKLAVRRFLEERSHE
jgi:RNA polymerase sigma-70 factor (ECF subfamily)